MLGLKTPRSAQTRVFEALLALTVIAIALTATRAAPTQPAQPPQSPQTLLNYLVYSGTIQYGLKHPQTLAQILSDKTANSPWALTVYTCSGNILLRAQSGKPSGAAAAEAIVYSPQCVVVVLQLGG